MRNIYTLHIVVILLCFAIGCKAEVKEQINKDEQVLSETTDVIIPIINNSLLDSIQKQTFNYFWEGAEPNSGLARERIHIDDVYPTSPKNTVTTGGSGFGLMAILVGVEHHWITRDQALNRYLKIVNFLEKAERFHGAWPHWINGETGKVYPFSKKDNGGDLVETAFLIQGLLSVSEYYKNGNKKEQELVDKIDKLWKEVEWSWYTKIGIGHQNIIGK